MFSCVLCLITAHSPEILPRSPISSASALDRFPARQKAKISDALCERFSLLRFPGEFFQIQSIHKVWLRVYWNILTVESKAKWFLSLFKAYLNLRWSVNSKKLHLLSSYFNLISKSIFSNCRLVLLLSLGHSVSWHFFLQAEFNFNWIIT